MNNETKHYRKAQFERLEGPDSIYPASIKLANIHGTTNCLDVSDEELAKIKRILLGLPITIRGKK